jgi:hypothetical protein
VRLALSRRLLRYTIRVLGFSNVIVEIIVGGGVSFKMEE